MSHPPKRRRLNTSPSCRMFLDLEARVEDVLEEEDEEEDVQNFIDDTNIDDDAPSLYSQPMALAEDFDEDNNERVDEGNDNGYVYDEDYWEKFSANRQYTRKYMQRIAGIFERSHDDERRPPELGDDLWEIGCKIGTEEDAVFEIGARFMDTLDPRVRSVIGRKTLPGRIYVEAASEVEVFTLARTVDQLNSAKIRRLGLQELLPVLLEPKPVYRSQTWRRILGPWREYQGDVALVAEIEEDNVKHLFMAAVPRMHLYEGRSITSRPPRKLFKLEDLEDFLGHQVLSDRYRAFNYKGRDYMPEGYFIEYVHKARLSDEVVPSLDELNSFKECVWLEPQTYERTALLICRRNIKPHDRVKVVGGNFINLIGQVVEISEHEVEIFLPSQDANERILLEYIRPHFAIGDEVKLLGKDYEGTTAWVVGVAPGELRVVNVDMHLEVAISSEEAQFYESPHSATLRIRQPPASKTIEPATVDPHQKYVGKQVMATGSASAKHKHPYKGYVGLIKSTAPDGTAWVELQALQRKVKFDLDDLCLCSPDAKETDCQPITTFKHFLDAPVGPSGFAEIADGICVTKKTHPRPQNSEVVPHPCLLPPAPAPKTPGTPMPDSVSGDNLSPAWDPSSRIPTTTVESWWLKDPAVVKARLKMVEEHGNGKVLEFAELLNDEAQVKDLLIRRNIPLTSLRALLPTRPGDLVVPITGDTRGKLFKVIVHGQDTCVVHHPGTRLKKHEVDPTYATADLVQVFPPLERRRQF